MAFDRDTVQLILDITGAEKVEDLARSTEHFKSALIDLGLQLQAGEIKQHEFLEGAARLQAQMERTNHAVAALTGKGSVSAGMGGQGILGASYAVQDLTASLSGGQGLARALGSVANNIPQILMGLGAGAGLTGILSGLFALLPAGISLVEKWWGAIDSESADKAKEKLKSIREEIERTHAEFKKLTQAPTDYEKTAAEGVKLFLEERPNAERSRRAIAAGLTTAGVGAIPDQYRKLAAAEGAGSLETDEELMARAEREVPIMPGQPMKEWRRNVELHAKELRARRGEARGRAFGEVAQRAVADAKIAGPEGDVGRQLLGRMTAGQAGFGELRHYTPEAIKAAEEEFASDEGPGSEAYGRRLHEAGQGRRKAAREAQAAKEKENRLIDQLNEAGHANQLQHFEELGRSDAAAKQQAEADRKKAAKASLERRAAELADMSPEIVANQYGPQAGMAVANASPAALQAMTREITENLKSGQFPAEAVLNAFREVKEATDRTAQANWQFANQLNGFRGRIGSPPGASGLGY